MDTVTINVKGMNANVLTKALKGVYGVHGVDIDLWQNQAIVTYDETIANIDTLRRVITDSSK